MLLETFLMGMFLSWHLEDMLPGSTELPSDVLFIHLSHKPSMTLPCDFN